MMYKKLIAFLLAIIFLFSNMGAVVAREKTYVNSSSVSDYVIMYLLKELDIISEEKDVITRGTCLDMLVKVKESEKFYPEEGIRNIMNLYKVPIVQDWDSLTISEKNTLFVAGREKIFFGEENNGELYANLDKPLTYYEAISFLLRCYYSECSILEIEIEELNSNWIEYAEDAGILFGRIPDFVEKYPWGWPSPTRAKIEQILSKSADPIPSEEFYCMFYNMLTAPFYTPMYRLLIQGSILNSVILRKEGIDVKQNN